VFPPFSGTPSNFPGINSDLGFNPRAGKALETDRAGVDHSSVWKLSEIFWCGSNQDGEEAPSSDRWFAVVPGPSLNEQKRRYQSNGRRSQCRLFDRSSANERQQFRDDAVITVWLRRVMYDHG
jgi:hypothetical protein